MFAFIIRPCIFRALTLDTVPHLQRLKPLIPAENIMLHKVLAIHAQRRFFIQMMQKK